VVTNRGDDGGKVIHRLSTSVHGYPQVIHSGGVTYPQVIHRLSTGYLQLVNRMFTELYTQYTEDIHRDPTTETTITEWFKGSKRTLSQRFTVTESGTENTIKNGS
jgi:DNA-binding transcriptional regulator YbjK